MYIDTLDLITFFRDNNLVVSEADCYLLVKQYDSNADGVLSLIDFMFILCPRTYTYTKNFEMAMQRENNLKYGAKQIDLGYRLEFAVMQVLQK